MAEQGCWSGVHRARIAVGKREVVEDCIMGIIVRQDDLSSAEVQSLIAEHLSGVHSNSPPGHVNALAIEKLQAPSGTAAAPTS